MCAYRMRTSTQLNWNGKDFSLSFSFRSLSVLSLSFLLLNYSFPFYFVLSFSTVFHCSSVGWSVVRSHSRFNLCHFVLYVPTNAPAYSYIHNERLFPFFSSSLLIFHLFGVLVDIIYFIILFFSDSFPTSIIISQHNSTGSLAELPNERRKIHFLRSLILFTFLCTDFIF